MENKRFPFVEIMIVIAIVLLLLFPDNCSNKKKDKEVITIPEHSKTTDTIVITKIIEKKIYLKGKSVAVDGTSYDNYEKEVDTVKKKEIFLDAITIRKYDTIIEDNDKIKIKIHAKTKGELVNINADYTIKENKIEIPKKSYLLLGAGANTKGVISINPGFQLKNGDILSTSINSNKSFSLSYTKRILSFN